MTQFELLYILPTKLEEADKKTTADQVGQLVASVGGILKSQNSWMSRKLSYPINHIRQGVFMLANIDLPSEAMDKFRKELEMNENIIRYLLTKIDTRQSARPAARPTRILPQQAKVELASKEAAAPEKKVSPEELDKRLEELLEDKQEIK